MTEQERRILERLLKNPETLDKLRERLESNDIVPFEQENPDGTSHDEEDDQGQTA